MPFIFLSPSHYLVSLAQSSLLLPSHILPHLPHSTTPLTILSFFRVNRSSSPATLRIPDDPPPTPSCGTAEATWCQTKPPPPGPSTRCRWRRRTTSRACLSTWKAKGSRPRRTLTFLVSRGSEREVVLSLLKLNLGCRYRRLLYVEIIVLCWYRRLFIP